LCFFLLRHCVNCSSWRWHNFFRMLSRLEKKKESFFLDSFWKKTGRVVIITATISFGIDFFSSQTLLLCSHLRTRQELHAVIIAHNPRGPSIQSDSCVCACKLIHDKSVYIFIGLFDITLPFYNWIGDSALSFSIRKESGTTKLNAIPYFCFVFFFKEEKWWTWWKWRGRVILWVSTLNRVIKLIAPCVKVKHEEEEEWQCQLVYGSYHLDVE
jgi:hypothetical protein